MRRRALLGLLGAAAVARNARAALPEIGFLNSASPGPFQHLVAAFHQGLHDNGFVEGQNVAVAYRWAEGSMTGCRILSPICGPGASP